MIKTIIMPQFTNWIGSPILGKVAMVMFIRFGVHKCFCLWTELLVKRNIWEQRYECILVLCVTKYASWISHEHISFPLEGCKQTMEERNKEYKDCNSRLHAHKNVLKCIYFRDKSKQTLLTSYCAVINYTNFIT